MFDVIAARLHVLCVEAGLPPEDLWIDPLVLTVSADQDAGRVALAQSPAKEGELAEKRAAAEPTATSPHPAQAPQSAFPVD